MYHPHLLSWSVDLGSSALEWGHCIIMYPPCVFNPFHSCLHFTDALFFPWSEIIWQTFTDTAQKSFGGFYNLNHTVQVSAHSLLVGSLYYWLIYLGLTFKRSWIFTIIWKHKARVIMARLLGWWLQEHLSFCFCSGEMPGRNETEHVTWLPFLQDLLQPGRT